MDPSLHVRMTERSHPSRLPPRFKKSRSRIVEREKKKSKNSRSSRSSKVVPFPVLLRTARCSSAIPSSVFPTFSSSVSPLYIFTSAVFVSNEGKRLIFFHFFHPCFFGAAVWLHSVCRAENFPLFPSPSLTLSLSFDW